MSNVSRMALVLVLWPRIVAAQGTTTVDRQHLPLVIAPDTLAVCQFPPEAPLPAWALVGQPFLTVSRTRTELSITAPEALVADQPTCERDYRAVRVAGPLPLDLVGIVAALAEPLARDGISLFAISTYETDYILVKARDVRRAVGAWQAVGHRVSSAPVVAPPSPP